MGMILRTLSVTKKKNEKEGLVTRTLTGTKKDLPGKRILKRDKVNKSKEKKSKFPIGLSRKKTKVNFKALKGGLI